jgi:hypothetical protein
MGHPAWHAWLVNRVIAIKAACITYMVQSACKATPWTDTACAPQAEATAACSSAHVTCMHISGSILPDWNASNVYTAVDQSVHSRAAGGKHGICNFCPWRVNIPKSITFSCMGLLEVPHIARHRGADGTGHHPCHPAAECPIGSTSQSTAWTCIDVNRVAARWGQRHQLQLCTRRITAVGHWVDDHIGRASPAGIEQRGGQRQDALAGAVSQERHRLQHNVWPTFIRLRQF